MCARKLLVRAINRWVPRRRWLDVKNRFYHIRIMKAGIRDGKRVELGGTKLKWILCWRY